jgi:LPS sulfotransferase NodH
MRSLLICATPRSGSTLLCELLKDTRVAGKPEEFFEARSDTGLPPHPGDYLDTLPRTGAGIRDDAAPPSAPAYSSLAGILDYRHHLQRTFRLGTTANGVFSAKLMWRHLAELEQLAGALPEYAGLERTELLERLFDRPRYVWVTRRDKVRQAVSLWRALQTRTWRLEHSSSRPRERAQLHYRYEGIDHLVSSLQAEDEEWQRLFSAYAIPVVRMSYEDDLERDRDRSVQAVLDHIGVARPPGWRAAEMLRRQADALSDAWVTAYHRDSAERGWRSQTAAV